MLHAPQTSVRTPSWVQNFVRYHSLMFLIPIYYSVLVVVFTCMASSWSKLNIILINALAYTDLSLSPSPLLFLSNHSFSNHYKAQQVCQALYSSAWCWSVCLKLMRGNQLTHDLCQKKKKNHKWNIFISFCTKTYHIPLRQALTSCAFAVRVCFAFVLTSCPVLQPEHTLNRTYSHRLLRCIQSTQQNWSADTHDWSVLFLM